MKHWYVLWLFVVPTSMAFSQSGRLDVDTINVNFQRLSWEELRTKAMKEDKYIFVDLFAGWCAPCKAMDDSVYPIRRVAEFMNQRFISVRYKIDSSRNDDDWTKSEYARARRLMRQFAISDLPTYLF